MGFQPQLALQSYEMLWDQVAVHVNGLLFQRTQNDIFTAWKASMAPVSALSKVGSDIQQQSEADSGQS